MVDGIVREAIEYHGISDNIPSDIKSFKTINFDSISEISERAPNISDIMKVNVNGYIKSFRLIRTGIGISLDGQELTGWKLILSGQVKLMIDYISTEENPAIYASNILLDFNTFITLPSNTYTNSKVLPNVYIEDIYVKHIGLRQIFINSTIILTADIY